VLELIPSQAILSLQVTLPVMSDAGSNAGLDEAALARKQQLAENLAIAKAAGWQKPIPFNYDTATGGQVGPDETRDSVAWLSDAAIYAWDDDFGEIGEPNPELEKMLFDDETLQRAGGAIKALSFKVDVEGGDERVPPVREVSLPFSDYAIVMLTTPSSMTPVSTLPCFRMSSCASTSILHPFRRTASRPS
jgi:hypothetical protein